MKIFASQDVHKFKVNIQSDTAYPFSLPPSYLR